MSSPPDPTLDPTTLDPTTLKYDDRGLLPVVAQDVATGAVLMLAWADEEAVRRTLDSGDAWFWSRSREEHWRKGATSGNTLRVVDVRPDCDRDALLYRVHPAGPACHRGTRTCFEGEDGPPQEPRLELGWLMRILESRRDEGDADSSYTARLLAKGTARIAQKVAEEGAETAIGAVVASQSDDSAASSQRRTDLVGEAADLLYHLLVLLLDRGIDPREVAETLGARHRASRHRDLSP